jgi:hypothetical protein
MQGLRSLDARASLSHPFKTNMKAIWGAVVVAALMTCGCSRFNRDWRELAPQPTPTDDITGRWEGRWESHVNGHNDVLRAIITAAGERNYDVRFRAAYKKGITIHFGYTVRMEATPSTNGIVTFHGREDLGFLAGGTYTYKGEATPTNFFSTYDSKYDRGTFQMRRPD